MLVFVAAGIEGGKALLVGSLGRGLDVVGAVRTPLYDGFSAIEAAIITFGKVAFEPFDRDDVFDMHVDL